MTGDHAHDGEMPAHRMAGVPTSPDHGCCSGAINVSRDYGWRTAAASAWVRAVMAAPPRWWTS